ncbi:Maf-like protein [Flavobacterium ardleyense]|uniref:Maf-like protein n=1 Tax=Flavobacterium ardleyense TaxID=2038737 RepID=UPI00298CDFBB|nr:Maf-like protein [Flavobacterium ardleyense]
MVFYKNLNNTNIILASGSPRRQQFFLDLNIKFEVRLKEIEEVYPPHLAAAEIPQFLAELKANAFKDDLKDNDLLITSDTIVWLNDKALGKPNNYNDAFAMLREMSGKVHDVITSVCFMTSKETEIITEITKVYFNTLNDQEIEYYINTFEPYDKAGAYGIQDWIGLIAVKKIEGSYANVMGMPVDKVYEYLKNF